MNVTDPDSRLMHTANGWLQGYNVQAAINHIGIVIAAEVFDKTGDVELFIPMIDALKVSSQITGPVGVVLADAGYCSKQNLTAAGPNRLIATANARTARKANRPPTSGPPPDDLNALEAMDHTLRTPEGRRLYKQRSWTVEPGFGNLKPTSGSPASPAEAAPPPKPNGTSSPRPPTYSSCTAGTPAPSASPEPGNRHQTIPLAYGQRLTPRRLPPAAWLETPQHTRWARHQPPTSIPNSLQDAKVAPRRKGGRLRPGRERLLRSRAGTGLTVCEAGRGQRGEEPKRDGGIFLQGRWLRQLAEVSSGSRCRSERLLDGLRRAFLAIPNSLIIREITRPPPWTWKVVVLLS